METININRVSKKKKIDLIGQVIAIKAAQADWDENDTENAGYIKNKPTIGNGNLTLKENGDILGSFGANSTEDVTINLVVPVNAGDVNALPNTTKYAANILFTMDSSTFVITAQLQDQDGNNIGSAQTIDLPMESVVVNGAYDFVNKQIVLTLQNGATVNIPVGDLVAGLQTEITNQNKLASDLVDDTGQTHKFVSEQEKNLIAGAVQKTGDTMTGKLIVPTVKTSYLEAYGNTQQTATIGYLAIDADQKTVTFGNNTGTWRTIFLGNSLKHKVNNIEYDIATTNDLATKQDALVSGDNIKTINGNSLLGSGDIVIQGGVAYTAGTGINITNDEISANIVSSVSSSSTNTESVGAKLFYDTCGNIETLINAL